MKRSTIAGWMVTVLAVAAFTAAMPGTVVAQGSSYWAHGQQGGGGDYPAPPRRPVPQVYRSYSYQPAPSPAPVAESAVLVVRVPEEATVYLEGRKMKSQGTLRRFVTPELEPGTEYTYTLKVQLDGKDQPITRTKTFAVRAGETINVRASLQGTDAEKLALNVRRSPGQTYRSYSYAPESENWEARQPRYNDDAQRPRRRGLLEGMFEGIFSLFGAF